MKCWGTLELGESFKKLQTNQPQSIKASQKHQECYPFSGESRFFGELATSRLSIRRPMASNRLAATAASPVWALFDR
jgi:hypothetical protein